MADEVVVRSGVQQLNYSASSHRRGRGWLRHMLGIAYFCLIKKNEGWLWVDGLLTDLCFGGFVHNSCERCQVCNGTF